MPIISFSESCLHIDVLCVCKYFNYILAGVGNRLFVYEGKSLIFSKRIFADERIHSIYTNKSVIALKGIKKLCLAILFNQDKKFDLKIISEIKCNDWIQDIIFLDCKLIGTNTAHNRFQLWELETGKCIENKNCMEKCILYSCKVIGNSKNNIIVFSGTVFGEIQVWSPFFKDCESDSVVPFHKFKGHNGAVFSIEVNPSCFVLCTTSDDRSLKVWKIVTEKPLEDYSVWKAAKIELFHIAYTHTARVWKSLIVSEFFITIGEDSKLAVWRSDGTLFKILSLHRGGGIRAVHYSKELDCVLTGGEDGGINSIKWSSLVSEPSCKKVLSFNENFSTKVNFIDGGLVYTRNEGCVFVTKEGNEIHYKNKVFQNYCILEVTTNKDFIFLGSIQGHLIVIETKTKNVLFDKKCLEGRVYSIHWLCGYILTCGPEGSLDLWKFDKGNLKIFKKMTLPTCKERWTTCGILFNNHLFVGDRMGNIHIFDVKKGGHPVQSYRKIHKHLGVTDMKIFHKGVLSVGRDGTAKVFTNKLQHSLTYKLPMDWPWKIVHHQDDILIFGFHSISLVVFSMKIGEIILKHDCGGGHRSCDFELHSNILSFLYVKEKSVYIADLKLDEVERIRNGFHSKEINSLKIITSKPPVVITGSEDTFLRISVMTDSDLQEIEVLKTHTSSVRGIAAAEVNTNESLILSVGGKGQMVFWLFNKKCLSCEETLCHFLKESNKNWKNSTPDTDPDVRIMCADLLVAEKNTVVVVVGCSDAKIRMFRYNNKKLTLVHCFSWYSCFLKVLFFKTNSKLLYVCSSTNGEVIFCDISNFSDFVFLKTLRYHESGINSMQMRHLENEKFLLVTGGDDNKIVVYLITIFNNKLNLLNLWQNNTSHSCQITGIEIVKNFLITASGDQRVTVWQWSVKGVELRVDYENQYMTCVPDVQGIQAEWTGNGRISVFVYGKGIERVEVDVTENGSRFSRSTVKKIFTFCTFTFPFLYLTYKLLPRFFLMKKLKILN